uniref:CYTH domain-containing protein n=1 Tax=Pundamilia nyererei TaxID=303518 RepID=A0A3B4FVN6_9CICH
MHRSEYFKPPIKPSLIKRVVLNKVCLCKKYIFQLITMKIRFKICESVYVLHIGSSITNLHNQLILSMPSNVEIKAKVSDLTQFAQKAAELSQSEGTIIRQHDTFFSCSQGRLKLRDFMNGSGQLIFYERPDTDGPKLSRYSITPTSDPQSLQVKHQHM